MSDDVLQVMNDLAIDAGDLFGYSMGAFIGAALLGSHPGRFTSMILDVTLGGSPLSRDKRSVVAGRGQGEGHAGRELVGLASDGHLDRVSGADDVGLVGVGQGDLDAAAAEPQRETEVGVPTREAWVDGEAAVEVTHAAEAEHERHPGPGCGGDVHAVGHVAGDVARSMSSA